MNAGTRTLYCLSAAILATVVLAAPQQAGAQTASDLKCRGCVGKKDLGKKAVASKHIKPGAVDSAHIKAGAIDSTHIKDGAIDSAHIKDGAIESADIAAGAVAPANLAQAAQPTGAEHEELALVNTDLTSSIQDVLSVTLNAPTDGYAVVTANWTFFTFSPGGSASCYLETAPDTGTTLSVYTEADGADTTHYSGESLTHLLPVTAGANAFYLNCREHTGNVVVSTPQITALFVPNMY